MKDSRHEAERWLRQAENDLRFGAVALSEGFFDQACFISQQVAEKALKALLYAAGERIVLGHSVVELVGRVAREWSLAAETEDLRQKAGVLDQYYVPTRYPNGLPGGVPFEAFGESQGKAALEAARGFVTLARSRLSPQ